MLDQLERRPQEEGPGLRDTEISRALRLEPAEKAVEPDAPVRPGTVGVEMAVTQEEARVAVERAGLSETEVAMQSGFVVGQRVMDEFGPEADWRVTEVGPAGVVIGRPPEPGETGREYAETKRYQPTALAEIQAERAGFAAGQEVVFADEHGRTDGWQVEQTYYDGAGAVKVGYRGVQDRAERVVSAADLWRQQEAARQVVERRDQPAAEPRPAEGGLVRRLWERWRSGG